MIGQKARNKTESWLLKATGEITLYLFCIIPGLVLSFKALQEPWTMFRIARVNLSLQTEHITTFVGSASGYRAEHIGGEVLQTALLQATAWPLESLALVPAGSLLLAILYYAISTNLSRSRWTAAGIAIYASWYYPRLYSQYSTQTYVWTNILFLSFLILFLFWSRNRTITLSLLTIVLFITTFLFYHTTPVWIIIAVVSATALKLKDSSKQNLNASALWALPVFLIVFYLHFDTVLYGNVLDRIQSEAINESFVQSLASKIIAPLLARTPDSLDAFEIAPFNTRIATWSTLLALLLSTIPVGIWSLIKVYRVSISRNLSHLINHRDDIFVWAIIIVAVTHALLYSLYGALSLRVVPLAFPLLLPLVTQEFRFGNKLEQILVWTLAICAVTGFLSFAPPLLLDTVASETGLAAKLIEANSRVLSDANTYGSLLLNATEEGEIIDFIWPDSNQYASIVGRQSLDKESFDYLAIDLSNKPITTSGWNFLEPWTWHLSEIKQNEDLNKIYDSERLILFQPQGAELPGYHLVSKDINTVSRSLFGDTFWLFLTVSFLIFMPGAILVYIIRLHNETLQLKDASTLTGLAVGFGIVFVTFTGYFVNFLPLGLTWIVPMSITIPWILLGIYVLVFRPSLRSCGPWLINGSALVILLFVWSLLSTGVAHARTESHSKFMEFFVTQADPQSRSLNVNVINRLKQAENLTIVFVLDGVEVQTLGPYLLEPGSFWVEKWSTPPGLASKRLSIRLEKDGIPYRELHLSQ